MILRPPPAPFDPWSLGNTRFGEPFIWISAAVALVIGVILLVDYFNTKRISHLLWSVSFIGIWIYFHVLIAGGTYTMFLAPSVNFQAIWTEFIAMLLYLIPALLATGLYFEVFEDKRIGNIFGLFVVIMTFFIFVFKIDPSYGKNLVDDVDVMPGIAEFFLLGVVILAMYGIITSKRWEVQIPGIEFETRAPVAG